MHLSLLCAALTRRRPRVTADWICVIKDDKQNHLLVISICHRSAFAISGASLKKRRRVVDGGERKGIGGGGGGGLAECHNDWETRGVGGWQRDEQP